MAPDALQAYRLHEAATVKMPYLAIALALVLLGLAIAMFKLPRIETTRDFRPGKEGVTDSIWKYRHTLLGVSWNLYLCGAEVAIGSFLVKYFSQPDTGGTDSGSCGASSSRSTGEAPWWAASSVPPYCRRSARTWPSAGCQSSPVCWWLPPCSATLAGGLEHSAGRAVQLRHVPDHLYAGHCGTRPDDRQRLRPADCSHRRRRGHSGDRRPRWRIASASTTPSFSPHSATSTLRTTDSGDRGRRVLHRLIVRSRNRRGQLRRGPLCMLRVKAVRSHRIEAGEFNALFAPPTSNAANLNLRLFRMRVVSLLASATEIVCALGAGDTLVGRSHECDNPDWVRRLPACSEPAFDVIGFECGDRCRGPAQDCGRRAAVSNTRGPDS